MKYLSLHIKNIASIEKADIYFDQEPFSGNPIFLICGETGSGKSTILDAICLALYANTPRINNSASVKEKEESEVMGFKDIRQMMRRGAKEGSAELRFIGNDEQTYIALWTVRQKRTGKIEDSRSLECPMKGLFFSKKKEIDAEIERCVGMKYEQFCRTSLLAQGEFTKFLSSNEKEKSDILEKLTGTEIYSQIGIAIFEKAKAVKEACADEEKKIEGFEILTEEETRQKKEELKILNDRQTMVQKGKRQAEGIREWLTTEKKLQQDLATATQNRQQLEEEIKKPDFIRQKRNIEEWSATIEVRNEMLNLKNREAERITLSEKEENIRKEFRRISGGITWAKEKLTEKRILDQKLTKELEEQKEEAEMYEAFPSIQENLNGYLSERKEAEKSRGEAKRIETEELPNIQKKIDEIAKIKQECDKKEQQKQAELTAKQDELKGKDLNQLNEEITRLQQLDTEWRLQQKEEMRLTAQQEKLTVLTGEEKSLSQRVPDEKKKYEDWKAEEQKHAKSLQALRLAVGDAIKEIRHSLKVGDECPICGKKIDSIVKESELEAAIAPYEKELEEIRKSEENALRSLTDCEKRIELILQEKKNLTEEIRKIEEETKHRGATILQLCQSLSIPQEKLKIGESIAEKKSIKEQERETILNTQKVIGELQKEKDTIAQSRNKAQEALIEAEKRANAAKERITESQSIAKTHDENAQKRYETAAQKIKRKQWERDIPAFLVSLEQEVKAYKERCQTKERLILEISQWENAIEAIERDQIWILQTFPDWESDGVSTRIDQLTQLTSQLAKECSSLQSDLRKNQEERTQLTQKIDDFIRKNSTFTQERLAELQQITKERFEEEKRTIEEKGRQIDMAEGEIKSLNKRIEETQAQKPEGITSETTLAAITEKIEQAEAEMKEIIESTAKIELEFKRSEENIRKVAEVRKNVEKLREEWSKWDILNQHFGSSDGKSFRLIAQSYVLRQLLNNANAFLMKLNDRYELSCNSRSLGIWVRDLYMGGNVRPCNTLSGGESFIISLALALGLSTLNKSKLTTDIIFIDEGFGTLSADYLDAVMNMLEKLHNLGGKKVGIISHVEILKERIPTQIRVSKRGINGCSEVQVKG